MKNQLDVFPNKDMVFPISFVTDGKVFQSARIPNQYFISLNNGIISLNQDGTWEWSERPD